VVARRITPTTINYLQPVRRRPNLSASDHAAAVAAKCDVCVELPTADGGDRQWRQ